MGEYFFSFAQVLLDVSRTSKFAFADIPISYILSTPMFR
jgi:hypothetical protein